MMKKYYVPLCMLLAAIFIFTSCENQVEEKLEGDWKMVTMETSSGSITYGRDIDNPVLSIEKNKTYTIFMNGRLIKGNWKVKDNSFYLMSDGSKDSPELQIDSLTDETLIYHNKAGIANVVVYYTKVENEEEEGEKK